MTGLKARLADFHKKCMADDADQFERAQELIGALFDQPAEEVGQVLQTVEITQAVVAALMLIVDGLVEEVERLKRDASPATLRDGSESADDA